jgi:hypothetical protein
MLPKRLFFSSGFELGGGFPKPPNEKPVPPVMLFPLPKRLPPPAVLLVVPKSDEPVELLVVAGVPKPSFGGSECG